MTERRLICPICGEEFIAKAANAKYCSVACRSKGTSLRRKAWEEKTGYRERKRQEMQEYREKKAAEAKEAQEEENKKRALKAKRATQYQNRKRKKGLEAAAAAGDHNARMILAATESGNSSPEYWDAYKDYCIAYAQSIGRQTNDFVNDIPVTDPDFTLKVMITIQETGQINIENGIGERINDNAKSEL